MTVSRPAGAFHISMTGQIGSPVDLVTHKFEMTYSADWHPRQLAVEAELRNESLEIGTTFGVTTATNEVLQGQRRGGVSHEISPRSIVLPVNFFGAYEAVAARLAGLKLQPGSRFPVYVAPEGEVIATVVRVSPRRISAPGLVAELQEYDLTLSRPGLPMSVQVLIDSEGKLARVIYRDVAFAAIREEFATVMAREVRVRRSNDEDAFMPASGFSLAGTLSRPEKTATRLPAVILVGGSGRQDRDETLYGVPIFGHLAGALADAGYLVVRYDKRGVGQSGGRVEHAGVLEYAEDLIGIVQWLRRRKDVDPNRIAVLTHGEGSAIGLTAAGRERRIRALGLIAAPGTAGREVVLEQQQQALIRRNEPETDRVAKVALQRRIIEAVVTGKGWEALPPEVRRQADTEWFRTWLQFDPAVAMKRVNQPLLILHGANDLQMPVAHGEKLAAMSAARRVAPEHTNRVVIPGVNHLLVAGSGELDTIERFTSDTLSPDVVSAVVSWLRATLK